MYITNIYTLSDTIPYYIISHACDAARAERQRMIKEEQELCRRKMLEALKLPVEYDHEQRYNLIGQSPAMTEEQQENAHKRTEVNLWETTQQQIERELFASLLKVLTGSLSLPFKFSFSHTHTHKAVRDYGTGIKYLLVPIDLCRNIAGVH